jgi:primosomal protein N' (replication factor Y)
MKAQVLLPKVFNFPFTYYNNQTSLRTGDFVEVPFGKNKEIGVVWTGKVSDLKNIKIKNINKKINDLSINKKLIDFIEWFAAYNMMPLGLVLKMSIVNNLNSIEKKDKDFDQSPKKIKRYSLNDEQSCNMAFKNYS